MDKRTRRFGPAFVVLLLAAGGAFCYGLGAIMSGKTGHPNAAEAIDGDDAHVHTNRLIHESSPYLLQHAGNPVDWYPWSPEAFQRARDEGKPVFLSIGYSTCHWCHVMESESFEDEATAAILNEHFIAIKVDREERPDVDATYMNAVQMLTGSGGWPLSVFLTPEGKPFYGGTYFPPKSMYGRPSFTQVLVAIDEAWRDRREELLASSREISRKLHDLGQAGSKGPLSPDILSKAFAQLSSVFDRTHGGFGRAPKFPQSSTLTMLLGYWHRRGDDEALAMVTETLDAMAAGGIHDHLGGGFHRYATDAQWLVPHFEKMLYDQALLGKVYVQAYQATGREAYAAVARDIFDYVLRDMADAAGGFYAAEDADSEGREGVFYVWRQKEIEELLGKDTAKPFAAAYGVTKQGNFEDETNILHVARTTAQLGAELAKARSVLFEHRKTRQRPHRDDKIITSWNGLMISSLAYGGAVLGEPRYVEAARKAAGFVLDRVRHEGRLMRYFRAGRAVEKGFLDDYAAMILGLMDLYEASFELRWLREAMDLADRMIELFADQEAGGFFLAGHDAEQLIMREKPSYDGAVPSGNSMAALALLRLHRITAQERFGSEGRRILDAFSETMSGTPTALTALLVALDFHLGPTQEIVIVSADAPDEVERLIREIRRCLLPNAVLMLRPQGPDAAILGQIAPFTTSLGPVQGRAAAYVCEDYTCRQPVMTPEDLVRILTEISQKH